MLQACEELLGINRYSAGWGYSELVEIRVRRGDLDGAEEALAEAIALGDDGQPGRGRLLLAQGDARAAVAEPQPLAHGPWVPRAGAPRLRPPRVRRRLPGGRRRARQRPRASPSSRSWPDGWARRGPAAAAAVARGRAGAPSRRHRVGDRRAAGGGPHVVRGRRPLRSRRGAGAARSGPDRPTETSAGARLELKAAARLVDEFGVAVDLDIAPRRPDGGPAPPAPSCSPTSSTRRGCPRRWATPPGSRCCAGTTAPCEPSSSGGTARRSSTGATGSSSPSAMPTTASSAPLRSSAPSLAIVPSTASRPSVRIGLHVGEATARDARLLRIGGHPGRPHLGRRRCRRGAGECGRRSPPAGARSPCPMERTLELKGIAEPVTAVLVRWDDPSEV